MVSPRFGSSYRVAITMCGRVVKAEELKGRLEFRISYGPMFFPSFNEWHRGRECLDELAVQRAFKGEHPYDKPLEETNRRVAELVVVERVCYITMGNIREVTGPGSFQAMDATYPISEEFWPD